MIQLYYEFNEDSIKLHESLKTAGIDCPTVVIEDNGFLPDEAESAYGYFCGLKERNPKLENPLPAGKPRYFNQISIPQYWEISANAAEGEIRDHTHLRGKIYYAEPQAKRRVKVVDWMDDKGRVRYCDHYDRFGFRYAQTVITAESKKFQKLWFSKKNGGIAVVENFMTGDVILTRDGKMKYFTSKTDFVIYYLLERKLNLDRIIIDSLYYPYFISEKLGKSMGVPGTDLLFWHENIKDSVPGNMKGVLSGTASRLSHVYVQDRNAYNKLCTFCQDHSHFSQIGYIYPICKTSEDRKNALILTNTDTIPGLTELAEMLPWMRFHVSAVTEMSAKLLSLSRYPNILLYPGSSSAQIESLQKICGIYLDINTGRELLNVVSQAFLRDQIILTVNNINHSPKYVADCMCFPENDWQHMAQVLCRIADDPAYEAEMLQLQHEKAMLETPERFREAVRFS